MAKAARLLTLLRAVETLSFVCLLLDTFRVMSALPSMAIATHALWHSLPELATLCLVIGMLMACMAMLLYVSSPMNERLTRIDLLASYMFNGLVAGACSGVCSEFVLTPEIV